MNEACASNIDPTIPIDQDAETLVFEVSAEAGSRLDANLAARLEDRSRTSIKRLIEDGDVLVDGRNAKPAHKLRMGERVEVDLAAVPISLTEFLPENIPLEIIYEDDCLIVVNKPAGLVVHPGAGVPRGTLANALAYHFQQLSTRGGGERPGIVHRLDRDTSGLIVVAKTEIAHEKLAEQFRTREVFKSYVALVHGHVPNETGRIDQPVGRDSRHRTRMWVVRGGRPALTLYRVRRRYERMTLLDVEIKTGRTHQIRVHLASINHPIVGDATYNEGRDNTIADSDMKRAVEKLNRFFLHAEKLTFKHPITSETIELVQAIPGELESFLEKLR